MSLAIIISFESETIFPYIYSLIYIYINILSKFLRQGVFTIITIQNNTLGSDSFSLLFSLQLRATVISSCIQLYLRECWANVEILLLIYLLMSCKGMRTSYLWSDILMIHECMSCLHQVETLVPARSPNLSLVSAWVTPWKYSDAVSLNMRVV